MRPGRPGPGDRRLGLQSSDKGEPLKGQPAVRQPTLPGRSKAWTSLPIWAKACHLECQAVTLSGEEVAWQASAATANNWGTQGQVVEPVVLGRGGAHPVQTSSCRAVPDGGNLGPCGDITAGASVRATPQAGFWTRICHGGELFYSFTH